MKLPFTKRDDAGKSYSVMPEYSWEQMLAAQDVQGQMSLERAVGLPAVMAILRLISNAAGLVPLMVLRGDEDEVRERARDTWQWRLLQRAPGPPPSTPFSFKADLAMNLAGRGNAYIRKYKVGNVGPSRPRVAEIEAVSAAGITTRRASNGAVQFYDTNAPSPVTRGTDEMIQIRGASTSDGLNGVSPITSARLFVSAGIKREQFEDRHLANGIFPGMALKYPANVTEEQAKHWVDFLNAQNQGSGKAGKLVAIGGGADLVPLPISLADAQFADMTRLTLEQAASMWQVPMSLVMQTRQAPTDDDWRHFITFALGPIFTATAQALTADRDLFDPVAEADLAVVPDPDALLRLDPLKKAQVQREQIQTGTRLVDELRADDGYGPLPPVPQDWTQQPGKVPQITPVGGAPNPTADTTPSLGGADA